MQQDDRTFTSEEWIAAFSLLLPPDEAREEGLAWKSLAEDPVVEDGSPDDAALLLGPPSYDGDILDLLSLVSDSCAERVWAQMGITREEGERRRQAFRHRLDEARRLRDEEG